MTLPRPLWLALAGLAAAACSDARPVTLDPVEVGPQFAPDAAPPRADVAQADAGPPRDAFGPAHDSTPSADAGVPSTDAANPPPDAAAPAPDAAPPPPPEPPSPRVLPALFERLDAAWNQGMGLSDQDNEQASLAWGESYVMQAYVAMFDATGEGRWLQRLAEHIERVLAHRDDRRGVADYAGRSRACWRDRHYQDANEPFCYAVHTGQITLPMALLADRLAAHPELAALPGPAGDTLGDAAARALAAALESAAVHDDEYRPGPGGGEGYYVFPADAPAGVPQGNLPANQQNVLGSVLAVAGPLAGDAAATDKAARLGRLFLRGLAARGDAWVWDYWNRPVEDRSFDGPGEDLSHAAINVQFAALLAARGAVFNAVEMRGFVATFTDLVTTGEADVADHVDGTGNTGDYDLQIGRWLPLTPWDTLGAVFFTVQGRLDELLASENGNATNLLALASMAASEPDFTLSAVTLVPGPASAWAGLAVPAPGRLWAARNFDGSVYEYTPTPDGVTLTGRVVLRAPDADWAGLAPFPLPGGEAGAVAARNRDGAWVLLGPAANGELEVRATDLGEAAGARWAAVATGVFAPGGPTLVVAARNAPDGALLLRDPIAGTTLARATFGADVAWGAVAACDLDADGRAEILAARNRDAHVLLLRPDADTLRVDATLDAFGPASDWAGAACGDFDADGRNEVVLVRNFDGAMYSFALDAAGALVGTGRRVPFGASHDNAPLAAGRLYPDRAADRLLGASHRTGHVLAWSLRPL
jgi:hypothetical protein